MNQQKIMMEANTFAIYEFRTCSFDFFALFLALALPLFLLLLYLAITCNVYRFFSGHIRLIKVFIVSVLYRQFAK